MQQTIAELFKSDFGQFFHLKEQGRKSVSDKNQIIYIKTGGFQEFIDILVLTDKEAETIIEGALVIKRKWLDNRAQSMLGLDLIKSFMQQFSSDKEYIMPLVKYLWKRDSVVLNQKDFIDAVNVIFNKKEGYRFTSTANNYELRNTANELNGQILNIRIKNLSQ